MFHVKTPNGIPFGGKFIGKMLLQYKFDLIQQDAEEYFSLCVEREIFTQRKHTERNLLPNFVESNLI